MKKAKMMEKKVKLPKVKRIKKVSPRVPSGVPGLDKEMNGGFLRGTTNLIGGGAGAGKSIFCMQFLIDGIKKGENGIFISFEEKPEKYLRLPKYVSVYPFSAASFFTFSKYFEIPVNVEKYF